MMTYEVVQHRTCSLPALALASFSLALYCAGVGVAAGAAGVASIAPTTKYEAVFTSPWDGDNGLQHLEHVNIYIPSHDPAKRLYYEILGLAPDARRAQNIGKGSGTIWANIGTSQIHLPEGEPQVVPGTIGLAYDSPDLAEVLSRLKSTTDGDTKGNVNERGGDHGALEGTKFGWREASGGEEEEETVVDVTCPYGMCAQRNVFRLHERNASDKEGQGLGTDALDPRGGRLPSIPVAEGTSSSSPLGLGIAYVSFRVRPGTVGGIARFYREVFSAEVEEIGGGGGGGGGDSSCATQGGSGIQTCSVNMGAAKEAVVRVGPVQYLAFVEGEEALPEEYDGHHICVYLTEEGFHRSYVEAERRGLVFVNPRRNFGKADTLEKALEEKQFRIKDMVDPATGEVLHELEHEIRSVAHPSYPVGRDLSAETPTKK